MSCCKGSYCTCCCTRKFSSIFGMVLHGLGLITNVVGLFFLAWVYREGSKTPSASTVEYYGLWTACSPKSFDVCQSITEALPSIENAARGSQALIVLCFCLHVVCFVMFIVGWMSCFGKYAKLTLVFENRVIEFVSCAAAVLGFVGMLVFAGEVKNKAQREIGQEDQAAFGFYSTVTGQMLIVLGSCFVAGGRT